MNTDLKQIKKKYGEDMMRFCRDNLSLVLETPELLPKVLEDNFAPTHTLYNEIDEWLMQERFISIILEKAELKQKKEQVKTDKTPQEIFEELNYTLYECHTESDIQKFRKYYDLDEELCTFKEGNRLATHHVFFAVSNNIDNIKREDFPNPKREDQYGTSIMSLQFTRTNSVLSIKNRYNHSVLYPDSTYSNNLDNIYPGLTYAFKNHYGFDIKQEDGFKLNGFTYANDERWYPYSYEFFDTYYGPDNYIIHHGDVQKQLLEKEKYLVFDYFILDLVNKKVSLFDKRMEDSFPDTLQDIENIEIKKDAKENKKYIYIKQKGYEEKAVIVLDDKNHILAYTNNNVKNIGDNFLCDIDYIKEISLNNVLHVGNKFLSNNTSLASISLLSVKTIEKNFLKYNNVLTSISLDKLESIDDNAFKFAPYISYVYLPNIVNIGNNVLYNDCYIEKLYMPKVESIGAGFIEKPYRIRKLCLPNLVTLGFSSFNHCANLEFLSCPNLEDVSGNFQYTPAVKYAYIPKLDLDKQYVLQYALSNDALIIDKNSEKKEKDKQLIKQINA